MRKIIAIIALVIVAVIAFSSCTGEEPAPASSNGTYNDSKNTFQADVRDDNIKIYIVTDDSSSLYWDGTWENGKEKVVSTGDRKSLDSSFFGSQAKDKDFTVSGDTITFEFEVMGTTENVVLEKL